MAVTSAGFSAVRANIQSSWKHVELRDASNAATGTRIDAGTDTRCTWVTLGNALTLTVVLTGSDADMGVGKIIKGASLFDATSGGVSYVDETYADAFTFENEADKLTVKITINAPSA